jgi:hypothetical protein
MGESAGDMIILAVTGVLAAAIAVLSVWWASDRLWHAAMIIVLAVLLFPLTAASRLTGDVSRHFPATTFAEGMDGKDQIVVASVAASFLLALIVASGIWSAGKFGLRMLRRRTN